MRWFVIDGPDDIGTEFGSWAEAREYLLTLNNRNARILGPGWGDEPEYHEYYEYHYE